MDHDLDDDFFRNFGIEPDPVPDYTPHPLIHRDEPNPYGPRQSQSQAQQNIPSQNRQNRMTTHHPYMFHMPAHTDTISTADRASEYWRRRFEAQTNRQRVNAESIFGPSSLFDEPPEPQGFTDGRDGNRNRTRNPHDERPVGAAAGAIGASGATGKFC